MFQELSKETQLEMLLYLSKQKEKNKTIQAFFNHYKNKKAYKFRLFFK